MTMTDTCAACGLDVYDGGQLCPICRADPPPGFAPNGENSRVESSTDSGWTDLQRAAANVIAEYGGVMKAARALGCNHGVISLAAKGEDFPKARHVLGLPPKAIEVRPCPDCGQLHELKATCPHELQKQRSGPKRYRLHYEAGRGRSGREQRETIVAEMEAAGCESFTEYVDLLRQENE